MAERQAHAIELRVQALPIEKLQNRIAKLQHEQFGQSSERRALLDQPSFNCSRSRGIRPGLCNQPRGRGPIRTLRTNVRLSHCVAIGRSDAHSM